MERVSKRFGGIRAVDTVSFSVERGTVVGLIGPNGAGKSTLFNVISGFLQPDGGEIRYRGRAITSCRPAENARAGLVRTFQQPRALTRLSVRENVMLASAAQTGEQLRSLFLRPREVRRREAAVRERADRFLARVGLDGAADEYAGALSGGQRKLLELARVLMVDPQVVLLDEPMAGVNPTLRNDLEDLMLELRAETDLTIVLVEHDLPVVMRLSDRIIVMNQGRVIADGLPDEVRQDPAVIDAYLGEARAEP